ncbi:ricin-type beta-trefoil lectin domain protein [Micromonospora sp. NBC_01796]|uniref:ricin-type beta-trefoil lectin domain protein n=1 Tax=Micromonospora sp. NBC_01796 TaxID=2975987 RepID=UPI002DDA8D88|nr:ricin-type beta-trefoil lectin domain protein [Micromonospora sp. NBC_01796]WSA86845.1 ricin-type beta-trefoil lectin domain protein [Micromonospora sp. NBC_01796]
MTPSSATTPRSRTRGRVRPRIVAVLATVVVGLAVGAVGVTNALAATTGAITGYGGKCVDVAAASNANGTQVQLYTCNGSNAQQWIVGDDGTIRALGKCLDVASASTANGARVQIWDCNGSGAQQWTASAGLLRNPQANKCLDATGPSSADGTPLQIWECFGGPNQQWVLPTGGGGPTPTPTAPTPPPGGNVDLGPNVSVFDPSMSSATIQSRLNTVFNQQESNQFGNNRYALLFKPGTYNVDVNVGFYTQVAGLGYLPDNVTINGGVHVEADWFQGNATHNFWRGAENLSVNPTSGTDRWAVSQAAAYRRMHVRGNLQLDDGGWSSGGLLADTRVDGQVRSGSQQQWLSRNTQWGSWTGSNWNMVFVGAVNAPANSFPNPPYTTVAQTPVVREKPFLYVDQAGNYQVFVPSVRSNTTGTSWASGSPAGSSLPISQFFVVKPGATAATINAQLAQGKHLLFTPGIYHLNDTLRVTRPDTVVLGLGLATLVPDNGVVAMSVADVDGVKVAGLLFDAGPTNSPVLMEVGPTGSSANHSANPTSLHDLYFRVGGAAVGKATVSLRVNSSNVIGDHLWIWRGDHTYGVGWNVNTADTGLIVNGADVTMYGLFVEHYQKYQTIWNGERGRTYFYQNEIPYDVPNQASWQNGSQQGYAAYKVADSVNTHEAWGLGSYCFFNANPSVVLGHSFEVPNKAGVRFHNMVTVSLGGGTGSIRNIINNAGGPANSTTTVSTLVNYP